MFAIGIYKEDDIMTTQDKDEKYCCNCKYFKQKDEIRGMCRHRGFNVFKNETAMFCRNYKEGKQ